MDLLLDTHAFIWWDASDPQLGGAARIAIASQRNRVFVSAASVWEISIKSAKGKLRFTGSPAEAVLQNGFLPLAIESQEAEVAGTLDWGHADPFDRVLVAQAMTRGMTLIHADNIIADFRSVAQLWAR
jgi:PIN domain nuclease of toxin-antitoxin system